MVRTKWPRFFLICHAVHADAASRAGRYSTGTGDRRAGRGFPPPPPPPPPRPGGSAFSPPPPRGGPAPTLLPPAALAPAAAGAKRCFQAYSRLALIPNSSATTSADLRLASQLLTASRLNVS